MRDFSQTTKEFSYKRYWDLGFEVFTPLVWQLVGRKARKERIRVPFIRDLFFVHASRAALDPVVEQDSVVTYRFVKGSYHKRMVVDEEEMTRFKYTVEHTLSVTYFNINEISSELFGKKVKIVGGPLDGSEGVLASLSNSRTKWLLINIEGLFAARVKLKDFDYVRIEKVY